MDNKEHKRGSEYYDMTKWLLEHYLEFCITDQGFKGFSDLEGGRMPVPVVDNDKTFTGILCRLMSDAINGMDQKDHKHANVVYSRYFSGIPGTFSMEERIAAVGYTNGGYYRLLYRGIEVYSSVLWRILEEERRLPFYMYDLKGRRELILRMGEGLDLHEAGNSCYVDTERILKNYAKIKYLQLRDELLVLGDSDPIFGRSIYKPDMERNDSYLMMISDAVDRLDRMGKPGQEWSRLIDVIFLDPDVKDEPWRTKMNMLGLSPRTYYLQRNRAINIMSKLLWGPVGEKHYRSPFFGRGTEKSYGRLI